MKRALSWGLMQNVGQVARESGSTRYPPLFAAEQGLSRCKVLRKKFDAMGGDAMGGDTMRGLLAWNGGANAAYYL